MKKLIYKIEGDTSVYNPATGEVERQFSLAEVVVYNPTEEDIARAAEIAYNGKYTVENDGQSETASTDDVLWVSEVDSNVWKPV